MLAFPRVGKSTFICETFAQSIIPCRVFMANCSVFDADQVRVGIILGIVNTSIIALAQLVAVCIIFMVKRTKVIFLA
jgi:hypothetical protein